MSNVWPLVADVVVPSAAVLVSSGVAIWLARGERKAAARARESERQLVESGRRQAKIEETFEQILGTLAWFISADPLREEWQHQMRLLRGQAVIAQAVPGPELQEFAEWFASEVERGIKEARFCFLRINAVEERLTPETRDPALDQIMHPFRSWTKNTMDLIVMWLRGSATLSEIQIMADGAARLKWDADRINDLAERRSGGAN